jgi:ABC-type multidrug transport system fused ATPase/permease subunit
MTARAQIPSWSLLRRFVGARALAAGCALFCASLVIFAFDLGFALALQRFFAATGLVALPASPPGGIALAGAMAEGVALLALGAARAVFVWVAGVLAGKCQVAVEVGSRARVARWALGTGSAAIGRVMTLYNDVTVGSAAAVGNIFFLAGRAMLLLGTFGALLWYSPELTLAVLAVVAVAVPVHSLIDRRVKAASSRIQSSLAEAVDLTSAAVKNSTFLRIHGLAGDEARRIGAAMESYGASSERFFSLSNARAGLPQMIGLVVLVAIAAKGGEWLGDDGSRVVAFLFLVLRLFQSLADVARITGNLLLNWPRLRTLWTWWTREHEPSSGAVAAAVDEEALAPRAGLPLGWRAEGVAFAWDPREPTAIRDLSLDIQPGLIAVVTGPSGAGKTSLLLLLAGLVAPTAGRLELVGPGLGGTTPSAAGPGLLRSIAYVGPDPFVVPGTIRDQLMLGQPAEPGAAEIREALALAQCGFVDRLALGLDHPVTEQGGGLSAGQKQRLSIARAILRKPAMLLLDEATSNLDAGTEAAVVAALASLRGRMTIVAITHRDAVLSIADQVVALGSPDAEPAEPRDAAA